MTDEDDKTRFGAVPPPPKIPGGTPPAKPTADDDRTTMVNQPPPPPQVPKPSRPAAEDDRTQFAAPPPPPQTPMAGPPKPAATSDHTQFAAAPPPGAPRAPVAPSKPLAPPPISDTTQRPAATAEDATVIISDRAQGMVRLQRVQPPGRTDSITLDRSSYSLGRSPACDVELFSQTASREHARLVRREGQWFLEPIERKDVSIDGKVVRHETRLANRMRIQLGDDELLFLDGSIAREAPAAKTSGSPPWLIIAGGAAVLAALGAWLLFG